MQFMSLWTKADINKLIFLKFGVKFMSDLQKNVTLVC